MCASLCENRLGLRALVKSWNSLTSCSACYTVLLVFNSRAGFDVLSPVLLFYVFFTSRAEFDVLSPVLLFYVFFTSRAEFDSCKIGFSLAEKLKAGEQISFGPVLLDNQSAWHSIKKEMSFPTGYKCHPHA